MAVVDMVEVDMEGVTTVVDMEGVMTMADMEEVVMAGVITRGDMEVEVDMMGEGDMEGIMTGVDTEVMDMVEVGIVEVDMEEVKVMVGVITTRNEAMVIKFPMLSTITIPFFISIIPVISITQVTTLSRAHSFHSITVCFPLTSPIRTEIYRFIIRACTVKNSYEILISTVEDVEIVTAIAFIGTTLHHIISLTTDIILLKYISGVEDITEAMVVVDIEVGDMAGDMAGDMVVEGMGVLDTAAAIMGMGVMVVVMDEENANLVMEGVAMGEVGTVGVHMAEVGTVGAGMGVVDTGMEVTGENTTINAMENIVNLKDFLTVPVNKEHLRLQQQQHLK